MKRNYKHSLHKSLKEKYGYCFYCGNKDNLEVHHIDGNMLNNSLDNLTILCSHCHRSIAHQIERDYKTGRINTVIIVNDNFTTIEEVTQ